MLIFAEKLLNLNKKHVERTLNKILFVPSILMFLFGGTLIILLIVLTHTILKQISFIQKKLQKGYPKVILHIFQKMHSKLHLFHLLLMHLTG